MYLQTNLSFIKIYASLYMTILSLFKKKIKSFENEEYYSNCKKQYFRELSFDLFYDDVTSISHRRKIKEEEIPKENFYSIAYFDNGRLVRFDEIVHDEVDTKTFLCYKEEILTKAFRFEILKYKHNKKIELMHIWKYFYKNEKLNKLVWKSYADYIYAHHNTVYLIEYFVYDEKGLESIYKTFLRNELIINVAVYKKILDKKRGLTLKEITAINMEKEKHNKD